MNHRRSLKWLQRGLAASTLGALLLGAATTNAAPWDGKRNQFADPKFQTVWNNADRPVQQGQTSRSWTWGPSPWMDYKEFYKQSPNGLRQVQYFDKSRMEINNPASTSGPLGGVTNGLLPVEMISGRVKLGDGTGDDQNAPRDPAQIAIAGDPTRDNPNAPTYASFRNIATTDNGFRDQNKVGQRVGQTYTKDGQIGFRQDLANQPGTEIVVYETVTGHNVPKVFNDFRNSGPVPAIAAFGFPITDAYWINAKVGGQDKDILVQVFERRVVTYTPSNPDAFKVEMGNVGQHYFQWRYPDLGTPWVSDPARLPIAFASKRDTSEFNVYTMDNNGNGQSAITGDAQETVPFSMKRSNDQTKVRIFGDTKRFPGNKRQIVSMAPNGSDLRREHISTANDFNPMVSPDGTKIAFASDRDGNVELYLLNIGSTAEPTRLTDTVGCTNQYPQWLPDGSGIVYESNCADNFEIYRASLSYTQDKLNELTVGRLISPVPNESTRLTNNNSDDRYARLSPDGASIAFSATRDGNAEIYTMGADGSRQTRITNSPGDDIAPTWSPDGIKIVFASGRDGDNEIFDMNRDGSGQVQLTNNGRDDNYPIYAQ
jgi:WD40 repeat protein